MKKQAERLLTTFLAGKSENTVKAYRTDLADFASFLEVASSTEAAAHLLTESQGNSVHLVERYKNNLLQRGLASSSVNRKLAVLRSLTRLAKRFAMVRWDLAVTNDRKTPQRDTRGPGKHVIGRMLGAARQQDPPLATRDVALVRLMYGLGLRRSEVANLTLADVDRENRSLTVLGKGQQGKARRDPRAAKIRLTVPNGAWTALVAWLEERGEEPGPLFYSFRHSQPAKSPLTGHGLYQVVRKLGKAVGIEAKPHGIRHTAITEACKAAQQHGIGLSGVQQFSRHANMGTVFVYYDAEQNQQARLAQLVDASVG